MLRRKKRKTQILKKKSKVISGDPDKESKAIGRDLDKESKAISGDSDKESKAIGGDPKKESKAISKNTETKTSRTKNRKQSKKQTDERINSRMVIGCERGKLRSECDYTLSDTEKLSGMPWVKSRAPLILN